jgi:UDP-glucose 4-epimerase
MFPSSDCMNRTSKKILVTGGAGFIGSNFCNTHCARHDVTALDNLFLGDPAHLSPDVRFVEGDAADRNTLESLGGFDVIVHFAGTSSAPMFHGDVVKAYGNSILSYLTVLEFATACGAKKVLYASTSSLYGNTPPPLTEEHPPHPTNHYAVTKIAMEHISTCYHRTHPELDIIGFRFMSVYGPHEEHKGIYANLISQFLWAMRRGERPLIYGDGKQTRDFTSVHDVIQGITLAMETEKKLGNQVFNIGRGEEMTVLELLAVLNRLLGTDLEPRHIENPVTEGYIRSQRADIGKIQKTLGYNPSITLEEGVKEMVEKLHKNASRSSRNRTHEANALPQKA